MNKKIPIFLNVLLFIFILWLQTSSLESVHRIIDELENIAYDWKIRANTLTQHHKKFETSVVIVDIDDKSLAAEGRWPWPRDKLADLVQAIQAGGAAVTTIDLIFPQKETNIASEVWKEFNKKNLMTPSLQASFAKISPEFDYDIQLGRVLTASDTVIGFGFTQEPTTVGQINQPLLILTPGEEKYLDIMHASGFLGVNAILASSVKNMGFVNYSNTEGIIRRVPLLMEYHQGVYPSLALETARVYLLSHIKLVTADYSNDKNLEGINIGATTIPTDKEAEAFIPFRGPSFTFPYYSATDVLHKRTPPNIFEGKIVYIGTSATGLSDLKPTSVDNVFPGVEIQATITDGILKNDFWYKPAWALGAEVIITVGLGFILVLLYPFLGPRILIILTIAIPGLIVYLDNLILQNTGFILSVFFPLLLTMTLGVFNIIYGYLFESRHRKRLNDMFGQYVPKEHIDEMMKSSGSYGLHGENRDMSVLFSDIRGFTHISETMPAEQLKEMLNEVLTPLTEVIFNTKGTIDKYIGDAIMAFWGAPLNDPNHTEHALAAALDMQSTLKSLAPMIAEHGWPPIKIGIGVNRGEMIVGDMGSKYHRNYTVLGDEVNLASRIEGLTKFYGVDIIVTEEAQREQTQFICRHLDRIRVVGKMHPTNIYEIVCYKKDAAPDLLNEIALSDSGFDLYLQKKWDKAKSIFEKLHEQHAHTLYKLYMDRIDVFKINPPPADWDGTYVHTSK